MCVSIWNMDAYYGPDVKYILDDVVGVSMVIPLQINSAAVAPTGITSYNVQII